MNYSKLNKLVDNLTNWDGVRVHNNGEFIEIEYNHAFELMKQAALTIQTLTACVQMLDNTTEEVDII